MTRGPHELLLSCAATGCGKRRRSSTSSRPPSGTSARRTTSTAGRFAGPRPAESRSSPIPADLDEWTVPVRGHDPHQVAVGPIHAGVIESGHFRFHVVGERILHLDLRLFYKHRGLQRAAEGAGIADGLAYVQRACAADAVTNAVAYAQACEAAGGLVAGAGPGAGAHAAARARAALQPPQRHRRDLRRRRLRRSEHAVRGAQGARPAAEPAHHRASLPVRHRRRRPQRPADRRPVGGRPCGRSSPSLRADFARALARAPVRGIGPGAVRRRRARHRRPGAAPRGSRADRPRGRRRDRRPQQLAAAVVLRLHARAAAGGDRRRRSPPRDARRRAGRDVRPARRAADAAARSRREPSSGTRRRRSASGSSRALAARRSAPSRSRTSGSRASTCAPARTPTGRCWCGRCGTSCCRTSRSSTRASSSATPAWIADVRPPSPAPSAPARHRAGGRGGAGSLAVRHVDAGSCNGCEHELGAAANPYYDIQQYGLNIVASPRHADVLLVTGPVTTRMAAALPGRVRGDAGAAAGRGAGRLRARLRRARSQRRARPAARGAASGEHPHPGLPAEPTGDRRAPAGGARRANLTPPSPSRVES